MGECRCCTRTQGSVTGWLPLVDGTVLSGQQDLQNSGETTIVMFAPDGSEQVAWSSLESTDVDTYASDPMFTGPLDPGLLDGP